MMRKINRSKIVTG